MSKKPSLVLIGEQFGKWTVIKRVEKGEYGYQCLCLCDCGRSFKIYDRDLIKKRSQQCKYCHNKENSKKYGYKKLHGYSVPGNPFYSTYVCWCAMKQRCYNKSQHSYSSHGAKGIKVCPRWENSFVNFLNDMNKRPDGKSLDRIDNSKDYCKENCRWASSLEQGKNTSRVIIYDFLGEKHSETQWAEKFGLTRNEMMYWTRKKGIQWVYENRHIILKGRKKIRHYFLYQGETISQEEFSRRTKLSTTKLNYWRKRKGQDWLQNNLENLSLNFRYKENKWIKV